MKKNEKTVSEFDFRTIKTYDDAVAKMPVDSENKLYDTDSIDVAAYKKIKHIVKVINNGWTPDWNNHNQPKYYPWFAVSPSGSGFSGSRYGYGYTATIVGSRLSVDSSEKALYLADQFQDLYAQFLLITQ